MLSVVKLPKSNPANGAMRTPSSEHHAHCESWKSTWKDSQEDSNCLRREVKFELCRMRKDTGQIFRCIHFPGKRDSSEQRAPVCGR